MVGFTLMKVSSCSTSVSVPNTMHDDAGDQRHDRHMPRHHIGRDHRRHDRHHEGAGGDEQVELRVGDEEHDQRTEFGRELEQRMRLGLVHLASPLSDLSA